MSDNLKGRVIRLDERAEYQDGTVAGCMVVQQHALRAVPGCTMALIMIRG